MTGRKTFLIAGVGGGLGLAFAERALSVGHRVVGVVRRPEQVAEFEALGPGLAFARVLDIGSATGIEPAIRSVEEDIAPIDVLVAGTDHGQATVDDLRRQRDIDVFGTVAVVKAVLPGMRLRRAGTVVVVTPEATSSYHGSKFALVGIMLSLATEVAPFGVRVTAAGPEALRAAWSDGVLESADGPLALGTGIIPETPLA
ncbi:SDR family NAD(P)-dependent oxidoreductase [Umezawaea endophytica]|uniref:SDR family NAD(P)-dependent oxidoreductase n=1 Tax=Umezawaea endophytica TaxID=1654476 RepID=A0A9X3A1E6_9PSEU|nr:SDR family NAD(P)-dependent oxidoreductase [Umezawaea endophytica]MCS7477928.1 SDR family NAD(P)-dependent oxidoreductase [Umezawaea endophytica]